MFGQALKLALLAGLLGVESMPVGQTMIARPFFSSMLVGALLGDVQTGVKMGLSLELIWMGAVSIGAALPPDFVVGAVLATSFAIMTGQGMEVAIAIGVPAALAAQTIQIFVRTIASGLVHWADRFAQQGNTRGIEVAHLLGIPLVFFSRFIPVFLAIYFGVEAVQSFLASIPKFVTTGLQAAGGMLPALGFAMLLNMIAAPAVLPYFFVGFVVATFMNVNMIGMGILGLATAFLHNYYIKSKAEGV